MDYSKLSQDELIKICEEMDLDYMTKQKKPKAIKTLISLIKKNEPIIKTTYEDNYTSLEAIIDKCHNLLYSKGILSYGRSKSGTRVIDKTYKDTYKRYNLLFAISANK